MVYDKYCYWHVWPEGIKIPQMGFKIDVLLRKSRLDDLSKSNNISSIIPSRHIPSNHIPSRHIPSRHIPSRHKL